jgi:acyl-coenzyme A synthetase/AMP-(fatty) acid ligase
VVAIPSDGFEGWLICCAYVPSKGKDVPASKLRTDLSRLVPGYMLPARWMRLDALRKNDNGKTDRPRLKSAFLAAESPETQLEAR